jgi:cytochrome c-type biogenesis protein CcmH
MLANVEMMRGNLAEAVTAYRKLLALQPQDAQAFAEAAEALAAAQGGKLAGEPAQWVDNALRLAPDNLKARAMAGKAAFEARRYEQAAQHWERALALASDARARQQLEVSLAEARALQGGASAATPARSASGAAMAYVAGRVTLADALKSRIKPDDTVYVVARPAEGSRMPIALLKRRAADLPLDFALDDTLAMVPESRLSQHKQVIVRVLVSRRGDAIPASGDLQGQVGPVAVGSGGVRVEIRDVVP